MAQLRKEREEERQLAELQRLQEAATGKKRVERLDWMYAAPSNEGNALGGARISETMMEDYLLGKRRVDEVLAASDKNIGNTHKDFIAVQNANSARDTASKIREDPLLAIKKQEEAAIKAMANRPDIRRQLRAMKQEKNPDESKEERKARKREEKEERRREKHERREKRGYDRSPRSDYSDDRDRRRRRDRDDRDDREDRDRRDRRDRYRSRSRSSSPRRERRRHDSPRRHRDDERRSEGVKRAEEYDHRHRERSERHSERDERSDRHISVKRERESSIPPPRDHSRTHGQGNGHYESRNGNGRNGYDSHDGRPSYGGYDSRDVKSDISRPGASQSRPPAPAAPAPAAAPSNSLDDMRAARLAAMSASADDLQSQRNKSLAARAEAEKREEERDLRMRAKYGKEAAHASFFKQQSELGLSEALSRRGGQGLQRIA